MNHDQVIMLLEDFARSRANDRDGKLFENRFLRRVNDVLAEMTREAEGHTSRSLKRLLGDIAERFDASSAEVFVRDRDTLLPVVRINTPQFEVPVDLERSIVATVYRNRRAFLSSSFDVRRDPFYRMDIPESQSEIAVPLMLPHVDGRADESLAVVNLESIEPGAFNPGHLEELQAASAVLVPHLLVRQALLRGNLLSVPWHPEVHGWDLTAVLQRVCCAIAEAIDPDYAACSLWYHDGPKRVLFNYANSDFDGEYRCDCTLPQTSFMGYVACSGNREALWISPQGDNPADDPQLVGSFVRTWKARRQGIHRVGACPIYRAGASQASAGISVLSVHLRNEKLETPELKEALPIIADRIGRLVAGFERLRLEFTTAQLHHLLLEKPFDSESDFEVILKYLLRVFDGDAGGGFNRMSGRISDNPLLYCVATTGLNEGRGFPPKANSSFDADAEMPAEIVRQAAGPITYDIEKDKGLTSWLARNCRRPLRINNLLDPTELGHPQIQPMLKYSESFAPRHDGRRRFLGVGVSRVWWDQDSQLTGNREHEEDVLGVIRILRRPDSKPFTLCDERLLLHLSHFCWKQYLDWRRLASAEKRGVATAPAAAARVDYDSAAALSRICRPVPVARSTRALIDELVRDLHAHYLGSEHWCRLKADPELTARLLVRHVDRHDRISLRTYAFHGGAHRQVPWRERETFVDVGSDPVLKLVLPNEGEPSRTCSGSTSGWIADTVPVITFADAARQRSGIRTPFRNMCNGALVEGVLAVDFPAYLPEINGKRGLVTLKPIFHAACRLAAIWGVTDADGRAKAVLDPEAYRGDLDKIKQRCLSVISKEFGLKRARIGRARERQYELSKRLKPDSSAIGSEIPIGGFERPIAPDDPAAAAFGVWLSRDRSEVAIPLRLGPLYETDFVCENRFSESSPRRLTDLVSRVTSLWANLRRLDERRWNALQWDPRACGNGTCVWRIASSTTPSEGIATVPADASLPPLYIENLSVNETCAHVPLATALS